MTARVRVLVREGCHLCDDVVKVVGPVCAELGVPWETVDIDGDAELRAEFTDMIPVTFIDGNRHDYWRIDAGRFRAALAG